MKVKLPVAPYIIKGRGQHKRAHIICPSPGCPTAVHTHGAAPDHRVADCAMNHRETEEGYVLRPATPEEAVLIEKARSYRETHRTVTYHNSGDTRELPTTLQEEIKVYLSRLDWVEMERQW